jgi:hypothetical protein
VAYTSASHTMPRRILGRIGTMPWHAKACRGIPQRSGIIPAGVPYLGELHQPEVVGACDAACDGLDRAGNGRNGLSYPCATVTAYRIRRPT